MHKHYLTVQYIEEIILGDVKKFSYIQNIILDVNIILDAKDSEMNNNILYKKNTHTHYLRWKSRIGNLKK